MRPTSPASERGAALLLSLLLLSLLSFLVAHALQANQWQRRIASHEIAGARAEAAARSALQWGEQWLFSLPGDAGPECPERCDQRQAAVSRALAAGPIPGDPTGRGGLDPVLRLDERWWLDHAHADGFEPTTGQQVALRGGSDTPVGRWMVIPLPAPTPETSPVSAPEIRYYRVLARAVPVRRGEPVLLETVLARPWGDPRWQDPLPATEGSFCAAPGAPTPCGRLRWQQRP